MPQESVATEACDAPAKHPLIRANDPEPNPKRRRDHDEGARTGISFADSDFYSGCADLRCEFAADCCLVCRSAHDQPGTRCVPLAPSCAAHGAGRTREEEEIERAIALSLQETKLDTSVYGARSVDFFHYNGLHPPGFQHSFSSISPLIEDSGQRCSRSRCPVPSVAAR